MTNSKRTNHTDDMIAIAFAARITRRAFAARAWVRIGQPGTACAVTKSPRI